MFESFRIDRIFWLTRCQFQQRFTSSFLYECVLHSSFSVSTVCVCNVLSKYIGNKVACKMLVNLNIGEEKTCFKRAVSSFRDLVNVDFNLLNFFLKPSQVFQTLKSVFFRFLHNVCVNILRTEIVKKRVK